MSLDPVLRDLTDIELIARIAAGAGTEFEQLVRRHNQRLFRATRAVLRNDADAEDALQQAWLEIYRHLSSFRGDAAFTTWATRIAVNTAIRQGRKRPVLADADAATGASPDVAFEHAELGRMLERCLAQLPQGNREVMVLRDVLELDTAETAACLGLTEEAVRVRLHRARGAVAAAFAELSLDHVYEFDGARCDRVTDHVMAQICG
jgi:RNA polymerase sigma-70 factor, ECF subfamily